MVCQSWQVVVTSTELLSGKGRDGSWEGLSSDGSVDIPSLDWHYRKGFRAHQIYYGENDCFQIKEAEWQACRDVKLGQAETGAK